MRPTTLACARFESKGKPALTETLIDQPLADIIRAQTLWLLKTPMGHYIQITVTRDEADLMRITRSAGGGKITDSEVEDQVLADIMAALESDDADEEQD